jgi:ankyrin repeat protein
MTITTGIEYWCAINEYGQIALHAACENGKIDIVNSLLKCNSSMNLCDITGFTPLYIACCNLKLIRSQ